MRYDNTLEQHHHFSLLELNRLVRATIEDTLCEQYWLEAEVGQIGENNGHCYLEFIQKVEGHNTPVARAKAKCWRNVWGSVRPYFEHTTGQTLTLGMKVLVLVHPDFHEAFGFSWIVDDIDPRFTLGDMARRRQEIIRQLKAEGVFDLNRELPLPLFTQRIAVISSSTAAGYGDFCRQLEENKRGFRFSVTLYESLMQGEGVERSIISALDKINAHIDDYDCVVIIRGGGATSDMSGFDSLLLAENVANFPLPVITGIGHDRDECILDMVSHTRVKTPTAAAAFLIDRLEQIARRIDDAADRITSYVQHRMEIEKIRLSRAAERIPILFSLVKSKQENKMETLNQRIASAVQRLIDRRRHTLDILEQRTKSLDPTLLLQRGYTITLVNGHALRSPSAVKPGDIIVTRLADGTVKSTVNETKKI
ncbi:MAG: exodeoxyribonuclease VII large subunit [Prevotella sp.]|nr:exodeoxyribonuclease VII large subunit [Prevotella sp.]